MANQMVHDLKTKLTLAESEAEDYRHAAARLANALQEIYDVVGEIPEVKKGYAAVERDVSNYLDYSSP